MKRDCKKVCYFMRFSCWFGVGLLAPTADPACGMSLDAEIQFNSNGLSPFTHFKALQRGRNVGYNSTAGLTKTKRIPRGTLTFFNIEPQSKHLIASGSMLRLSYSFACSPEPNGFFRLTSNLFLCFVKIIFCIGVHLPNEDPMFRSA